MTLRAEHNIRFQPTRKSGGVSVVPFSFGAAAFAVG